MAKGSGNTRTVSSNNASAARKTSKSKMSVSDVKTLKDAYKLMESYGNLYNMPIDEQKKFTDSFNQLNIDEFNRKHNEYQDSFHKKSSEAFANKDEALYKSAEKTYYELRDSLLKEQKKVTDKYNEFVKVKK